MDEDLGVEPSLRAAVEAALGELARAYVLDRAAAASIGDERGTVVVRERLEAVRGGPGATSADQRRLEDALAAVRGVGSRTRSAATRTGSCGRC